MALWIVLLLGCSPREPQSPSDCEGIGDAAARDDCYAVVAPALFRTDPKAGVALVEGKVTDPTVRDFIWLEVTRDVDPNTPRYCERIQDAALKDRCMVLVSRPHLHRGLVEPGQKPPKSPMGAGAGGPPPGGPPPGEAAPVMPGGAADGSVPPPAP